MGTYSKIAYCEQILKLLKLIKDFFLNAHLISHLLGEYDYHLASLMNERGAFSPADGRSC